MTGRARRTARVLLTHCVKACWAFKASTFCRYRQSHIPSDETVAAFRAADDMLPLSRKTCEKEKKKMKRISEIKKIHEEEETEGGNVRER